MYKPPLIEKILEMVLVFVLVTIAISIPALFVTQGIKISSQKQENLEYFPVGSYVRFKVNKDITGMVTKVGSQSIHIRLNNGISVEVKPFEIEKAEIEDVKTAR